MLKSYFYLHNAYCFRIFATQFCTKHLNFCIMIYSSNLGLVDCTGKKCRVDGRVMDKFSLIEFVRHLDFEKFWYRLMYAYDTMSYQEVYSLLEDYLSGDLDED